MTLNVQDLYGQVDYLVGDVSGLSIYMQDYEDDESEITAEYDDGSLHAQWDYLTPVEPTEHGTVLILGKEYRAYVAQQIKFEPTKD